MHAALNSIASLLSDARCDAWSLAWEKLRYRHTTAVRALLADGRYAPSTANRHLAALRGVLTECWRLGYVTAEDFQRASDLEPVRGSRLPRGRALQPGEVRALFAACEGRRPEKASHGGARRGHPGAAVRLGAAPKPPGWRSPITIARPAR
jgi:integrase/recombinase XerC